MAQQVSYWRLFFEYLTPYEAHIKPFKKVLASTKTPYQEVEIIEFYDIGKALIIDGKTQSALIDEYIYHEALVQPAMFLHPNPAKVLVIGGGEGATIREVLRHNSVERVVMVDIDKGVIDFAKKYLVEWHQNSFDDPRLELVIGDGREYVEKTNEKFDVVILDVVDPMVGSQACRLYTKEFYKRVYQILREPGIVVTQATTPEHSPEVYAAIYNTLKKVFGNAYPYQVFIKSFSTMWGFVMAAKALTRTPYDINIEEELQKRSLKGELRFYDKGSHLHMFSIPKPLKTLLDKYTDISTDEKPAALVV